MNSLIYRYLRKTVRSYIHNYINTRYWEKYYKTHRETFEPSAFAKYCHEKYCCVSGANLLELGCGNGRDSVYFMYNGINVTGLDLVREQLNYLSKKYSSNNICFKCADFSKYSKVDYYDYIYSRFTIHAITEEQETETLENSYKNLKNGGLLFIEVRSIKDDMYKKSSKLSTTEAKTDHYRRFAIYDLLLDKIKDLGFEIVESIEAQGLAKYKEEDPYIIRVVAKK